MIRRIILFIFALALPFSAFQASAFEAKIKWQFEADGPVTSGLAINNNMLLFGDGTGKFYALDKTSGDILWTHKARNAILGMPRAVSGDLFFAQSDGEITALKLSDGSLLWRHRTSDRAHGGFNDGIAEGGDLIFAAKSEGELFALDASSGNLLWTSKVSENLQSAPSYGEGFVFLGEDNGIFSIIDSRTGKRINGGGASGSINTPVTESGDLYVSAWDGSVQAVRLDGVIPLWKTDAKDPVSTSPAISDGVIAVGTARGFIVVLNREDGRILWQHELKGGTVKAKPLIADGLIFAGSEQGNIYVLDAQTGEEKFKFETEFGIDSEPAYSDGVFYFGNEQRTIYALQ